MNNDNETDYRSAGVAMPQLSDETVVQIHDFIYFCLEMFEARYGDQIHRYYRDRSRDAMLGTNDPPEWGDLSF